MSKKNIGYHEFRNVPFVKQVYSTNIRNMAIISILLFLLWVELFINFVRTKENTAFFLVYTAIVVVFCGAWLLFVARPHTHPVYRHIAKYYGKSKEDIERGEAEISMTFLEQNLGFSFNKNYFSDTWLVRRNFLFSEVLPLPTPDELDEMEAEKNEKRRLRDERKSERKANRPNLLLIQTDHKSDDDKKKHK